MKRLLVILLCATPLFGQSNTGELRLKVTDPSGGAVKTSVQVASQANQYQNTLATDEEGKLDLQNLPFGIYQITISKEGFAALSESVEVRSSIPTDLAIQLKLASVSASVKVSAANTLIDPDQAGAVSHVGSQTIQDRVGSLPGRSLQDLVNSQPGWFYEGNAVLHPRESEYQTQLVVDGIPLTDNRSPGFGPVIEADDVQSLNAYTAGIPAEYGRKMGGVVEVNTLQNPQPGFHGQAVLSGGSYDTGNAFVQVQDSWGANTLGASASGGSTGWYLNPVVPQNFNNTATIGDYSANYQRNLTPNDRLTLLVRHEFSRYDIPNELVQQAAGQDETADNGETMGIVSYEHTFSPNMIADFRGMVRDNYNDFNSSTSLSIPMSFPIALFQHNRFREGYFKGALTISRGRHEIKVGVESDNIFLHENFRWEITDPECVPIFKADCSFDPSTPPNFPPGGPFIASRPDLEQAAFAQDLIHLGNWTVNAGLRWDHYQLLLNKFAISPRFAISRYFPSVGVVLHFSYDRVFQTPSFENLLLSSSPVAQSVQAGTTQLPVPPQYANYYEVGLTKVFSNKVKVDANYFRRGASNFADDNPFVNTPISFPISFRKALIYGAEAKVDLPEWKRFSGFLSYSYQLGNAWNPVTGGLFPGVPPGDLPTTGFAPVTQDQRNTARGRLQYHVMPRFWVAGGIDFGSGLPFQSNCDPTLTPLECQTFQTGIYGQQVTNRINFNRGRIDPTTILSASVGAEIYKSDRIKVHFQLDGENLTNVVDVIDFGGLFSGNAIGPGRSYALRLTTDF